MIEGSSFSGLLTRIEIGHMRIRPALGAQPTKASPRWRPR
jgi:hypothetical protein